MKIHDLKTRPIERVEVASCTEVAELLRTARRPLIFSGLDHDFEFLRQWDLNFLSSLDSQVPVQQPEPDGVNYFVDYFNISMAEFIKRIKAGEKLYIGAREIMQSRGKRSDKDGLGDLAAKLKLPPWLDTARIWSANLWAGAGNNRTLLHYDPWDSVLMLGQGKKEFIVLPDTETPKMYAFNILNYAALYKGKVLHSKVRPLNVQKKYEARFKTAEGFRGTITAGEMIFIPAGFWHYVESFDLNISINFFVHFADRRLQLKQPLLGYWIKDNITLWPVRWVYALKAKIFKAIRYFFPKKMAHDFF